MAAETGHVPNRAYFGQDGVFHLNGAVVADVNETDITANVNLASVTATATELNKNAGVTAGTTTASKTLVVDSNKALDTLTLAALKLGAGAGTTMSATAAELNANAGVTAGTTSASKALVVDANKALDVLNVVALSTGAGAGTAITATSTELNKNAGVTAGTAAASKTAVLGATKNLDTLLLTTATDQLLRLSPQPTDTYSATMTIDVTYSMHVVAGLFATSATVAYTPSAAGTAGDILVIRTASGAGGTVTATFAATFHSSGTQATTTGTFSTIVFVSDGTRWCEVCRTTALA